MRVDGRIRKSHELVQNSEFQLQLDAVNHGLESRFDVVNVGVLHCQEAHVHSNNDQIDPDQLHHDFTGPSVVDRSKQPYRRPYIHT